MNEITHCPICGLKLNDHYRCSTEINTPDAGEIEHFRIDTVTNRNDEFEFNGYNIGVNYDTGTNKIVAKQYTALDSEELYNQIGTFEDALHLYWRLIKVEGIM